MSAVELNVDGIVGPTHNYAGLSRGNLASTRSARTESNPRAAALQGLAKMKAVADLGVPQAVCPPHDRPHIETLRALGFTGSDEDTITRAGRDAPDLLAAVSSASAVWMANAATVSPSADTADGRVHITPANLTSQLHRSIEPAQTARHLRAVFPATETFMHHPPLPAATHLGDEGAANHLRLCRHHGDAGLELFVYGRSRDLSTIPARYPARQALEASQAVARLHGCSRTLFLRQNPNAVDAGAFHNDVVCVADRDLLFAHAAAFEDTAAAFEAIRKAFPDVTTYIVPEGELSLATAVNSYLFNSQLITLPEGGRVLVAPTECESDPDVRAVLDRLQSEEHIARALFVDVRQSMRNGGGPACLRLRVVLTERELAAVHPGVRLTDALHDRLVTWVETHYRDRLTPADLADPALLAESRTALDTLTQILDLPTLYPFQR